MNDYQENIFSMCARVLARLDKNDTIVSSIPALDLAKTGLKNRMANIRSTDIIATKKLTGITVDKNTAKKDLTNACIQMSSTICAYAGNTGNNTLYQEIYKSKTLIIKLRDDQLPSYANQILIRLNEYTANLTDYGITPIAITNFENLLTFYANTTATPRSAAATRKTAVKNLASQTSDIRIYLTKVVDKIVLTLKPTQPTFVSQYFNDRNIYDDGTSNNVIKIYKGTLLPLAFKNLGALPTGTLKLRITLISGGPIEVGLSIDGITFNGNTITLGGIGSETVVIVDLNSIGTLILLRNKSTTLSAKFKVEALK
jgi:hypothetical protein